MFRRQAKSTFNSHRWFSHRSGPRKSTYALTRGAAVATSVAAVAAATIASQKFIEGSAIHNDASTPSIAAATPGKVSAGTTRVGGTNDGDEEELKLLVWGSNRCVPPRIPTPSHLLLSPRRAAHCIYTPIHRQLDTKYGTLGYRGRIISPDESDAAQLRTPRVASFLQDVALRDLAVHVAHAACVDGRGDVYQWGDGYFAQESASASGDRKPILTLRGKVRSP
jgi:hypothetical protein